MQIWFESERIPDVSSMPVYKIIPMDEEQAAAYAHVVEAATADVRLLFFPTTRQP